MGRKTQVGVNLVGDWNVDVSSEDAHIFCSGVFSKHHFRLIKIDPLHYIFLVLVQDLYEGFCFLFLCSTENKTIVNKNKWVIFGNF